MVPISGILWLWSALCSTRVAMKMLPLRDCCMTRSKTRADLGRQTKSKGNSGARCLESSASVPTGDGEKSAWRSRKLAFVNSVSAMSSRALLVAAADKLHNVRDLHEDYLALGEDLWERFNGGRDGTLWYYRAMAAALCEAGAPRRLVDPLQRAIDELAQLMETAE